MNTVHIHVYLPPAYSHDHFTLTLNTNDEAIRTEVRRLNVAGNALAESVANQSPEEKTTPQTT